MESLVGTFRISQPGSSVATSLCEGEAVPKRVGLLDIIPGNSFRMTAVPLSQASVVVRAHVYRVVGICCLRLMMLILCLYCRVD